MLYQENISDKWNIPWYTTREHCITVFYHARENTVAITIKATYAWCMIGRLGVKTVEHTTASCFLIGLIFYGIV